MAEMTVEQARQQMRTVDTPSAEMVDDLIAAVRAEERRKSTDQPFNVGALIEERDKAEAALAEQRQTVAALAEALNGFISESLDEHGDDHHEDECPVCELIIQARAALALVKEGQ